MRWKGRKGSENIEDRRNSGGGGGMFRFPFPGGGRGTRMPGRRTGRFSIWTILLLLGFMWLTGRCDPNLILREILGGGGGIQLPLPGGNGQVQQPGGGSGQSLPRFDVDPLPETGRDFRSPNSNQPNPVERPRSGAEQDQMTQFVSVVLKDTEDVWHKLFTHLGRPYREPKLVLFSNFTQSACGPGMAAMGPFYCPLDEKVYVDLTFYRELKNKFGAPGDFAQAYVIAHEVGHHVQKLLGIAEKVQRTKTRLRKRDANALQVRMELQADCFSGIWARHANAAKDILEEGDLEEALNAASKIGDDNIQRRTQGRIVPEAFTHGTSEQRVRWFKKGFDTGNLAACETFNARNL